MVYNMNKFPFFDELDDIDLFGVDNDNDSDVDEEEENELSAFDCPRIICPLSVANLSDFKQRISPLSLNSPITDLIQWFSTGLELISNYDNN